MKLKVEVASRRLDSFLAERLGSGRTTARRLILDGLVTVDDATVIRPSTPLLPGMEVTVGDRPAPEPTVPGTPPRVVYGDDSIVVVDKPPGMVVHPAPGHSGSTLVDTLAGIGGEWSSQGGSERPGIVHRLDRGTSGLLVLARTDQAHESLSEQLRARTMGREYWALVDGGFEEERGRVDAPIGRDRQQRRRMAVSGDGRAAGTEFFVLERLPQHTALRLRLLSGRTHQIRVHLAYIGHPVLGDAVYGARGSTVARPALHAAMLHVRHPVDGREMVFCSPLPADLELLRQQLGGAPARTWPWSDIPGAVW